MGDRGLQSTGQNTWDAVLITLRSSFGVLEFLLAVVSLRRRYIPSVRPVTHQGIDDTRHAIGNVFRASNRVVNLLVVVL